MSLIGTSLGHYKIVRSLGRGGMGEVYLAEDVKLQRRVALKVLSPELARDSEFMQRFQREARAVAALNHPNIVTIHSVEEDSGVPFLTLELIDGLTLADLIQRDGLPLERILDIAVPLADAVSAAHERGIVHRDLKPTNVMVTSDGRVKVLDYGRSDVFSVGILLYQMATGRNPFKGDTPISTLLRLFTLRCRRMGRAWHSCEAPLLPTSCC